MSRRHKMAWITAAAAALVFVIDAFVPQGVATGVPYCAVVLITLVWASPRQVILTATVCTGLAIVGAFVSPETGVTQLWKVIANRGLALFVISATAALVVWHRRLHERLELLGAIVDSSQNATIGKSLDGKITSWNDAAANLFGYTAEEVLGRDVALLVPPECGDDLPALLSRLREGEAIDRLETVRLHKDGSRIHVALSFSPIWDAAGALVGSSAIIRDITQQKDAEARARSSQQRVRAIIETAMDALITIDSRGNVVEWGGKAEAIFGWTKDDALGRPLAELIIPPGDREAHRQGLRRYLATGKASILNRQVELTAWRRDGSEFPVELTVTESVVDADVFFNAFVRDITRRKQADEALKSLNDELEQRVRDRTELLTLLNDVSQAANEAESVHEALEHTLRRVSRHHRWSFGHAFLPADDNPNELVPVESCYEETAGQFEGLRAVTGNLRLARGQGLPGKVFADGEVQWTTDVAGDLLARRAEIGELLHVNTAAAFPILSGEEVIGVLEFFSTEAIEPDQRMLDTMFSVGTQLGRVIERVKLEKEMAEISVREQRRFGMELHDELGQQLTGTAMLSSRLHRRLSAEGSPYAAEAEELAKLIGDAQFHVRTLIKGLRPVEIEADGLPGALAELATNTGHRADITCGFQCHQPVALANSHTATQLFYIAREAVNNAVKHADATQIILRLDAKRGRLVLRVEDDGVGISPSTGRRDGMGLRIMRHRAGLIGARLSVTPKPERGTVVSCQLRQATATMPQAP